MRNIFSPESTLMRFLSRLFDIVALCALFVLFSLPVVTIGAAQAALSSAIRSMLDPYAEHPPYRAFIKGFSAGFGKITIVWICCFVPIMCMLYLLVGAITSETEISPLFSLISIILIFFFTSVQVMSSLMHARFDCRLFDLIKNSLLMVAKYPFRAITMGILVWAPLAFAIAELYVFFAFSPFFIFFYYSLVFMLCYYLIRKPFDRIVEIHFPDEE